MIAVSGAIFGTQMRIFGTEMTQTKPKYMLIEHGRYFYQRKVPLEFQALIGRKKWRAPLGGDFDTAFERLKEVRIEHDALLALLTDPEELQNYRTSSRRKSEIQEYARMSAEDAAYEKWCHANGLKTEVEEYFEQHGEDDEPAWEKVRRWLTALEFERTAHKPPSEDEVDGVRDLLARMARSGEDGTFSIELPPFEAYKSLVLGADETIRTRIKFARSQPVAMDDDEYNDRLCNLYESHFGEGATVPSDPEDRDEFDTTKIKLERRIARVARNPDTLRKVADKFYAFANLRSKTEDKYRRTVARLIADIGDIPVGQITSKMLRVHRDKLKDRGLLPSSIRAEFTPVMGVFNYAVDEELIEVSPMVSVKLPKERRAVEEMKWLPTNLKVIATLEANTRKSMERRRLRT
jgi:hypothetical protein